MKESRKWKILEKIIDIIYPRRCFICHKISTGDKNTAYVCPNCISKIPYVKGAICIKCGKPISDLEEAFCNNCKNSNIYFDGGVAIFVYNDIMKRSISMFKEHHRMEYGRYYAMKMLKKFEKTYKTWDVDMIIPVPSDKKKIRLRGFNNAYIIAKVLSEKLKIPLDNSCLIKVSNVLQKKLSLEDRKKNSKKSFILRKNIVQSKSVLIVDDVFTTGSTINSISYILKAAGASNIYFTTVCIGSESYAQ